MCTPQQNNNSKNTTEFATREKKLRMCMSWYEHAQATKKHLITTTISTANLILFRFVCSFTIVYAIFFFAKYSKRFKRTVAVIFFARWLFDCR